MTRHTFLQYYRLPACRTRQDITLDSQVFRLIDHSFSMPDYSCHRARYKSSPMNTISCVLASSDDDQQSRKSIFTRSFSRECLHARPLRNYDQWTKTYRSSSRRFCSRRRCWRTRANCFGSVLFTSRTVGSRDTNRVRTQCWIEIDEPDWASICRWAKASSWCRRSASFSSTKLDQKKNKLYLTGDLLTVACLYSAYSTVMLLSLDVVQWSWREREWLGDACDFPCHSNHWTWNLYADKSFRSRKVDLCMKSRTSQCLECKWRQTSFAHGSV